MGVVSHALLTSLGPQEFVKKRSAIDGPTEFSLVRDRTPNDPESLILLSCNILVHINQSRSMRLMNCLMFDGAELE